MTARATMTEWMALCLAEAWMSDDEWFTDSLSLHLDHCVKSDDCKYCLGACMAEQLWAERNGLA